MRQPARELLTVDYDGNEVPGFIIYALTGAQSPSFALADLSPFAWHVDMFDLHGNGWRIQAWGVAVSAWPADGEWLSIMVPVLEDLVAQGASVAWCGYEGAPFVDPPHLFDPEFMSGSVLMGLTSTGFFTDAFRPNSPLTTVDDSVMRVVRQESHGLSDAE